MSFTPKDYFGENYKVNSETGEITLKLSDFTDQSGKPYLEALLNGVENPNGMKTESIEFLSGDLDSQNVTFIANLELDGETTYRGYSFFIPSTLETYLLSVTATISSELLERERDPLLVAYPYSGILDRFGQTSLDMIIIYESIPPDMTASELTFTRNYSFLPNVNTEYIIEFNSLFVSSLLVNLQVNLSN